jgi:hypothetical protein
METEIRYSERSPRPFESRDASLTSDDVNELCRRWIEAERERTRGLLTELLVQINNDVIPEVVATLPDLRGPPGPAGPAGKLPIAKEWQREKVYYEGEVVTCNGATYQAVHDTGMPPDDNRAHWICLAAPGRDAESFRHRGTFKDDAEYVSHEIVALNGGSFLALRDKPGPCPGPGWQLLAAPGKRGVAGEKGPQGERGPKGEQGGPGISIARCRLDRERYVATPVMSGGTNGPPLELRGLFEQFLHEVA